MTLPTDFPPVRTPVVPTPVVFTPVVRTCVGCRKKASAPTLLRVVAEGGIVVPDPRRRLPGRGAWLHPELGCLDAAERRRAFGRALRLSGQSGSRSVSAVEVRSLLTSKAGPPVVSTP